MYDSTDIGKPLVSNGFQRVKHKGKEIEYNPMPYIYPDGSPNN